MLLSTEIGQGVGRSSLERMLDTIRLQEERPEGVPPALPARPTSRGRRLPSLRRPLPHVQFKAGSVVPTDGCGGIREEKRVVMFDWGFSGPESMPESEGYAERSENRPAVELVLGVVTDHVECKIAAAEETRNHTLQGILWVQKHYRGQRARCSFQELKRGVTTLQSFVRGERTRCGFEYIAKRWKAAVLIQKHVKRWIARKRFNDQRKDIILLQSVIRGLLVRRRFKVLKHLELPKPRCVKVHRNLSKHLQEIKDTEREHPQVRPSVSAELEKRVLQAEAALRYKEEENAMLQQQLQQYETRWSEYEAKMKSLEQTWQKQLTSLQTSLAAAKKSLVAGDITARSGRCYALSDHLSFDSEDTVSAVTHTPEATPAKHHMLEDTRAKQPHPSNAARNAVSDLVIEFEQRKQGFEDNAGFLMEEKSGISDSMMTPNEELQKLKVRYDAWRKDYRVRLQETKAALQKLGNSEPKARKRWWNPSCTR